MWVVDLIIEKARLRQKPKPEILPRPERKPNPNWFDITGFLKREKDRRVKERK